MNPSHGHGTYNTLGLAHSSLGKVTRKPAKSRHDPLGKPPVDDTKETTKKLLNVNIVEIPRHYTEFSQSQPNNQLDFVSDEYLLQYMSQTRLDYWNRIFQGSENRVMTGIVMSQLEEQGFTKHQIALLFMTALRFNTRVQLTFASSSVTASGLTTSSLDEIPNAFDESEQLSMVKIYETDTNPRSTNQDVEKIQVETKRESRLLTKSARWDQTHPWPVWADKDWKTMLSNCNTHAPKISYWPELNQDDLFGIRDVQLPIKSRKNGENGVRRFAVVATRNQTSEYTGHVYAWTHLGHSGPILFFMGIRSSVQGLVSGFCNHEKTGVPFYLVDAVRKLALRLGVKWIAAVHPYRNMSILLERAGFFLWDNRHEWQGPEKFEFDNLYLEWSWGASFHVLPVTEKSLLLPKIPAHTFFHFLPVSEQEPVVLEDQMIRHYGKYNVTILDNGFAVDQQDF